MAARKPARKPVAKRRPKDIDPTFLLPPREDLHLMIEEWVEEDVGLQDLTTNIMIPTNARADFVMNTRQNIVIAGIEIAAEVFRHIVPEAKVKTASPSPASIKKSSKAASSFK